MAIVACLKVTGLNTDLIKKLKNLELTKGRGNVIKLKKCNKIIELHNHSYNSSPVSLFAGLNVFLSNRNKKNLIIIGDMNELGNKSEYYHIKLLRYLMKNNNCNLLLVGKILYKFKKRFNSNTIEFYKNVNQLNKEIPQLIIKYNRIFIKGSNSINLQKTVNLINNK